MQLVAGEAGATRCWWGSGSPEYITYHDLEWGRAVTDDRRLFDKLCLEGFQSGLSWLTILRKRPAFREAFAGFDPSLVAAFDEEDVSRLLKDAGIVRHQGKIRSTINNARRTSEVIDKEGSFARWIWSYAEPPAPPPTVILSRTPTSTRLAGDLKKRGFSFVGPTTVYAFMQAMGLVNDHVEGCLARVPCEDLRKAVLHRFGAGK